jgi:AcrR family transcriptional regulator
LGRIRKASKQELLQATEKLLLTHGYDHFHFKILAKELGMARSTVYEYYANKEELVTEYMCNLMEQVNSDLKKIQHFSHPLERLKSMLKVFFSYSHIHQVLQISHVINRDTTEKVKVNMQKLDDYHQDFHGMIVNWIQESQEKGHLRSDISVSIIAGLFFTSIQIPNVEELSAEDWSEYIFKVICEGISNN